MIISQIYAQSSSTALRKAAVKGNHEISQCLIENDASVDAQDKGRNDPHQEYALCKL